MINISTNSEQLELNKGKMYIVIDALYLNEIKVKLHEAFDSWKQVRQKVFPYTDTPFAEYVPLDSIFTLPQIIKLNYQDVVQKDLSVFSTDTGLILFVSKDVFWDVIKEYSYDDLVNSELELLNFQYWTELTSRYNYRDIALLTSFEESKYDFDGSGTYKITR